MASIIAKVGGGSAPPEWPKHGGEMASQIRSHDWASTPLGPISAWPDRLKSAVELCLSSARPCAVCWGSKLTTIFNDLAAPTVSQSHPDLLGRPAREVWIESWLGLRLLIKHALSTGRGSTGALEATNDYGDGLEHAFFDVTVDPLWSADEHIAGVFISGTDTTAAKSSDTSLRLALDVAELGAWDADLRTGNVNWSDAMYGILGYTVKDVTPSQDTWAARVHPDDWPALKAAIEHPGIDHPDHIGEYRLLLPDGEIRWCSERWRMLFDKAGTPLRARGVLQDVTERHQREAAQLVLIAELQHRTRNLLAVVSSIARQTAARTASIEHFLATFQQRLGAAGRAQAMLSRDSQQAITLGELVQGELEAHGAGLNDHRITVAGPDVQLRSKGIQTLALGIHELATNALKYGALSQKQARLAVTWNVSLEGSQPFVTISWKEEGVQLPSTTPVRRGYGRELLERALKYELKADTSFGFAADGVRCEIRIPI